MSFALMAEGAPFYSPVEDGFLIHIRVTPRGGKDGIVGTKRDAAGREWLCLRVAAPPDKGAANEAAVAALAKALGTSKASLRLISGNTARMKTIKAEGAAGLAEALAALREGSS